MVEKLVALAVAGVLSISSFNIQPQPPKYTLENVCNSNEYISYIKRAPKKMIDTVFNNGYHIEMVQSVTDPDTGEKLGGITYYNQKLIQIDVNDYLVSRLFIHEMAHAFDQSTHFPSFTKEFYSIYKEEMDSFKSHNSDTNYHKSETFEYFAEACSEYVLYPESLKESAPKTYEYIEKLM